MWVIALLACTDRAHGPVHHDHDTATPPVSPPEPTTPTVPAEPPGNILVLLADDVGIDKIAAYGIANDPPVTPAIDSLVADGVRFHNAWSLPSCSPARSALLTGRFGRRYGVGFWFELATEDWSMPRSERTIPELLAEAPVPYASALAGKWHLVSRHEPDAARDPLLQGFDHHAGSISNIDAALTDLVPTPRNYYNWEKLVDGVPQRSTTYATTDTADEAIRFVETLPEPWFVLVAFNAAHAPMHVPPPELTPSVTETPKTWRQEDDAIIEAMDTEIGRILGAMPAEQRAATTIVFLGDNGTPGQVVSPPVSPFECKGSAKEGGVRVPLVVTGPRVPVHGAVSEALVSIVDLLPTFAEIAGLDPAALTAEDGSPLELDGHSLLSALADPTDPGPNAFLYTEEFKPNGPPPYSYDISAVRDARFKTVLEADGPHLYDVSRDLVDGLDLLAGPNPLSPEAESAYEAETRELQDRLARLQFQSEATGSR